MSDAICGEKTKTMNSFNWIETWLQYVGLIVDSLYFIDLINEDTNAYDGILHAILCVLIPVTHPFL